VLPSSNRMRSSAEFSAVVRGGVRVRRGALVIHHLRAAPTVDASAASPSSANPTAGDPAPRVGLVVGRGVGESVVRHRVSRRLRAQLASRLDRLPQHSMTVVRALPEAASLESARMGRDLDAAFDRLGLTS
jgi:ribonuclease P protein component